ncbi:MAG TPA: hypothetical protein VN917_11710, partial [Xanthobacteraceae bacterium]|nr:hypothetical protein [Xanthobacteraceae bacterium]
GFSFGGGRRARAGLDVGHAATPRLERADFLLLLRQPIFARKRGFALSVLDIPWPGQGWTSTVT